MEQSALHQIRVVLLEKPRLLQEIVRAVLEGQPDVEIESIRLEPRELESAAIVDSADVLIVAEEDRVSSDYAEILYAHPRLRLIAISGTERNAAVCELRPHRVPLGILSPETLLGAIRSSRASVREQS